MGQGGGGWLVFREDTWDKINCHPCLLQSSKTEIHVATLTLSALQRSNVLGRLWAMILL